LTIPKRHFDRTKARFTSALKKDSSSLANSETQAPSKCVSKRLAVGTVVHACVRAYVRAYMPACMRACLCVCMCACVCARVRVHACLEPAHICQSNMETRILRTRSHSHRVIKHKILSPLQFKLWRSVHPVVSLHGAASFSSRLSLAPDPAGTLRNVSCQRLSHQTLFRGRGLNSVGQLPPATKH
jgi:hypothetical protein